VTTAAITDWRELASRESDGLVVSLFWSRGAARVKVAVQDRKLDEEFDVDVPRPCALDAYYHPFAYASDRGSRLGEAMRNPSICSHETERSI
jgi:hypothetical protein